jgi:hypothetical protein
MDSTVCISRANNTESVETVSVIILGPSSFIGSMPGGRGGRLTRGARSGNADQPADDASVYSHPMALGNRSPRRKM